MTWRFAILLFVAASAWAQIKTPSPPPSYTHSLPSYKDLKYPPLPPVKIPEPAQFTLSNGMRVFLLEDHELPLISGLALIRTGNLFDPPDKKGLSGIMADVHALRRNQSQDRRPDRRGAGKYGRVGGNTMDETSASVSFAPQGDRWTRCSAPSKM